MQVSNVNTTLNSDLHPLLVKDNQLYYLLNGDISDYSDSEQTGFVQNLPGNRLCYEFIDVFQGSIRLNNGEIVLFEGVGESSRIGILNPESCSYRLLIKEPCLNFQDTIKGIYRNTAEGRRIYFGNKNRFNFLDIDNCPRHNTSSATDCQTCGEEESCCFDCDSIKVGKHINLPCITLTETAGNIPNGVYQIAIAFSDNNQTVTEYYVYSELIHLWDKDKRTSGISIDFNDCFTTYYDQFEVVLIAHREDRATSAQSIGFFDTSQKMLNISELDAPYYIPLPIGKITQRGTYYQGFENLVENSERLILSKPCTRIPFDYRLQANEICVIPTVTQVAEEQANNYPSMMRDEVYAIDIAWIYPDGQESHRTHISNNCSNLTVLTCDGILPVTDRAPTCDDHYEVCEATCDEDPRKVFEIYNSGTFDHDFTPDCMLCEVGTPIEGVMGYWESQVNYPEDYPVLGCTPIRHHKFPDNCQAPITSGDCNSTCVNILGFKLTNVQPPVDCDGNTIEVLGYNVYVSDRSNHKSILSKGLLYNMGTIEDDCQDVLYSNFPFNDTREQKYLSDGWERNALFNTNRTLKTFSDTDFTYHSPDIHYIKGAKANTLTIYNEVIGQVQGSFHETKDYPKYQIPSSFGRLIAYMVGFAEAWVALNGEKCTIIKTIEECEIVETRVKQIKDFPTITIDDISGGSSGSENWTAALVVANGVTSGTYTGTGSVNHSNLSGNGTGDVDLNDYYEVEIGTPPCCGTAWTEWRDDLVNNYGVDEDRIPPCSGGTYLVSGVTFVDCTDSSVEFTPDEISTGLNDTECCVKFFVEQSDKNGEYPEPPAAPIPAPAGIVLTVSLEGQSYSGTVDNDGHVLIDFTQGCDDIQLQDLVRSVSGYGYPLNPLNPITPPDDSNWSFELDKDCECGGNKTIIKEVETQNCDDKETVIDNALEFLGFNNLPEITLPIIGTIGGEVSKFPAVLYYFLEGSSASLDFITSILKPQSYAAQYTAEANYNNHVCDQAVRTNMVGNRRRRISSQQYLQPINQRVGESFINNWCRENSDYLKLSKPLVPTVNVDTSNVLHSELCGESIDCVNSSEFTYCSTANNGIVQAVSYYGALTQYKPSQYGNLTDYISRKVNNCPLTEETVVYGGDTYISKMSVRRKIPLWEKLPLGLPNNTEWDTRDYPNLAYPTYWLNYSKESLIEDMFEVLSPVPFLGNFAKDFNLDQVESIGQCLTPLTQAVLDILDAVGGIYQALGSNIILLIEAVTGNAINPLKQTGIFYTHVTGIANFWVESEFNSSYRECNELDQSSFYPLLSLEELACSTEYHLPEQFLYNLQMNWTGVVKDTNTLKEFSCCIKEENVLAYSLANNSQQLGDEWLNFQPLNYQKFSNADGKFTTLVSIDDYNLFIGFEDAAYVTQYEDTLQTNNGNTLFIGSPDAFSRRLKKISTDITGYGGIIDPEAAIMSRFGLIYPDRKRKKWLLYNGTLNDITGSFQSWFKEYMNGEITGTFDNCSMNYYFTDKETGWTIHYKPQVKDWVSLHSWIPDDYISLPNNFLTQNDKGLWIHNQDYYETFYNTKHRFEVGVLIKANQNQQLQDIHVFTEWYESKGYDCRVYHRDKFFEEVLVYNNCGSTGLQEVIVSNEEDENYLVSNKVVVTNKNCDEWSLNQLTNNADHQPYICRNDNGWDYTLPSNTPSEEAINGRWFKIHLRTDSYPELKKLVEVTYTKLDQNIK